MGETQENWVTPWNSESHHLKYHLQLKTREDAEVGESFMGGYQEKYIKWGYVCYTDLSHCLFYLWEFLET